LETGKGICADSPSQLQKKSYRHITQSAMPL